MSELRIRNIEEDIVQEWKRRAKQHGRTLGEELRTVLTDEITRPRREFAESLRKFRESLQVKYGTVPDSTAIIRDLRDERG